MITNFKIFENEKINIGDDVYILKSAYGDKLEHPDTVKIIDIRDGRYVTDLFPNVSIHRGNLITPIEYDAKKYNL